MCNDGRQIYAYNISWCAKIQFSWGNVVGDDHSTWDVLILILVDVIIRESYQKICHQGENIIYKSLMSSKQCLAWRYEASLHNVHL